ncbi:MAG: MFS transporter [Thermomicrobiales bacterium]|nr:MFS transporter [Thermomicrobiales bacterium]
MSTHVSARDQAQPLSANWSAAHWMISFGYVWFFAGIAAFTPFAAIYYRGLGFNGFQVGILAAMPAIALSLTGAYWGAVADTIAAHRVMLRIAFLAGAALAFLASRSEGFALMFVWITLLSFSIVPLRSLMDHFAVLIGNKVDLPFGRIRLWGAFGYSVFALTLGRMMNQHVTSLFLVAYGISLLLACVATWNLPNLPAQARRPLFEGVGELVHNRSLMLLLFVAFAQAVAAFMIVASLGYHIKSMGGSGSQVGAAFAVAAVSELPFFMAGAWFVRRFGADKLIAVILVCYAVRMALLGLADAPQQVILLQALHGLTFGGFLVVSVPRAHQFGGTRYPATVQAMITTAGFGLGNVLGSFLGGALLDDTHAMYFVTSLLMLVVLITYMIGLKRFAWHETVTSSH